MTPAVLCVNVVDWVEWSRDQSATARLVVVQWDGEMADGDDRDSNVRGEAHWSGVVLLSLHWCCSHTGIRFTINQHRIRVRMA